MEYDLNWAANKRSGKGLFKIILHTETVLAFVLQYIVHVRI